MRDKLPFAVGDLVRFHPNIEGADDGMSYRFLSYVGPRGPEQAMHALIASHQGNRFVVDARTLSKARNYTYRNQRGIA